MIAVIIMLFIAGLYCVLVTRNLMRVLIGLELLTKAVTLLLILMGYATGREALAQSIVITLIVIEVVVIAVMAGVILSIYRHTGSLDAGNIKSLKG
ncbi:MAG: NADH-quinone oxidoreductase subunit K [Candidatus Omnitrophota bacterium]|nr:NADH-quinone oxidoreductase subunit K [Candidatus Omnitrophota bacterium]